jgi:hypothetical protein
MLEYVKRAKRGLGDRLFNRLKNGENGIQVGSMYRSNSQSIRKRPTFRLWLFGEEG